MSIPTIKNKISAPTKNWAGNITYSTDKIFHPQSVTEVQEIIIAHEHLKGLGTKHCFNTIADSEHGLVSMTGMDRVILLDEQTKTVTVEAGIKYGELAPYLQRHGSGLHNMASLPHISVAGSCITATHGSGVGNGNLATAIIGFELVLANGHILQIDKTANTEIFDALVVNLGAVGVVTKVTLKIEPTYLVRQNIFLNLPLSEMQKHFFEIMSAGYSVSLFTTWQTDHIDSVWVKTRVDDGQSTSILAEDIFYGATAAIENIHPIPGIGAEHCTEQMGIAGPWHERLPHFKMGFTPSSGEELQTEYFVPLNNAVEAVMDIAELGALISPHLLVSEIRTIAADDFWMSPCYRQNSVAIHFTWKQNWPAVQKLLPVIEKALSRFNARPHWGKLFTIEPAVLQSRYKKLEDFKKLVKEYDPKGKFMNEFLARNLFS